MPRLDLHRTADRAARADRPAGGARHHLPQHRQREHHRLLAPGSAAQRQPRAVDRHRLDRGRLAERAARHRRRRQRRSPAPATASSTSSTAPRRCASAASPPACRAWKRSKGRSPSRAKPGSRRSCRPTGRPGKGSPTTPKTPPRGRPWSKRARRSATSLGELNGQLTDAAEVAEAQFAGDRRRRRRSRTDGERNRPPERVDPQRDDLRLGAQRPARPPRPAARRTLRTRPGLGHRKQRRDDRGRLRRRRHAAGRRHRSELAAGSGRTERQARRAARTDPRRAARSNPSAPN